ncbi:PKD domain-containing protein [Hyalangium sp.]|uniref:PKD domain-containing protein n=1 Tax=Hyalangium sp. TaxID=2028555 RepID=UPI002D2C2922|nr:PKD domain-containing protein [Hyalangium sp.]HYH98798.1 PKD domain-containing protein [Hyalangium sp.]
MKASGFVSNGLLAASMLIWGLSAGCGWIGDGQDSEKRSARAEVEGAQCIGGDSYTVRQGTFTTTIHTIKDSKSAQEFYAYSDSSANTGLEVSQESTFFVYHDTTWDQFSLFMIHDKAGDESGGSIQLGIQGLSNASSVAVNDESTEGIQSVPTDVTTATWKWNDCCTDGTAVTFTSKEICVTIDPEEVSGISKLTVVEGAVGNSTRTHLPSLTAPFSICFNPPPSADPGPPQVLECTGNGGATATLDGSGSSDPRGKPLSYNWLIDGTVHRAGAVVSEFMSTGTHTADLTVSNGACQDTARTTVQVVDTLPPVVSVAGASDLWPPNHKYRNLSLEDCGISIQDVCEGSLDLATAQAAISCVSSDEPINGLGDGNTMPDIIFVDSTTVMLRSERGGPRDGRVYKLYFTVKDAAGNTTSSHCVAGVPHDQRGTPAVDSGEAYRMCRQ